MSRVWALVLTGWLVMILGVAVPAATADGGIIHLPLIGVNFRAGPPPLLISALYYDTYLSGEPDEAFQLHNPTHELVSLTGWRVSAGSRSVVFPEGISLKAHEWLWCARRAADFRLAFGSKPGCEYGGDSDPSVPDLSGTPLQLANTGGRVTLLSPETTYEDVLVYEGGDAGEPGWHGPAVYPYRPSNTFGEEGQLLYRKLDQHTGRPVADTNTRADWAQDPDDMIDGRKARYPGWDLESLFLPEVESETAILEAFIAPDHSYAALRSLLEGAETHIRFEGFTLESASLGDLLAKRARGGVDVEMLLEGSPPGGVSDQQRWIVQRIVEAGGRVYYLRSDPEADVHTRYAYQHGKVWLVDGHIAVIGSENPSSESFPDDDKSDGTAGRRGVYLVTDAPSVVARVGAIMDADMAGAHPDIWVWDGADPQLGAPPAGTSPSYASGGSSYTVQWAEPLVVQGTFTFQVIHAPEQSLRDADGMLGLVSRAGSGDTLLIEMLYEETFWGPADSSVATDPNPRLEAYIAAARRGARVRVLLDSYFDNQDLDSPRSNLRTVEYVASVARAEGVDIEARRRNPTGLGLHNKMVLAHVAGQGWAVVGSLNGGEVSAKLNRELALLVGSDEVYAYLAEVFWHDWGAGQQVSRPVPDGSFR